MSAFAAQHQRIRDNVIDLVRQHPSAITDYRKLLQYYWYYVDGLKVFIPLDVLEKLTQPESISRAYRKLVEEGVIIVDEKTKAARVNQERQFRQHYGRRGRRSGEDNFTM